MELLIALLPIAILLTGLIGLKMSPHKAGALALIAAICGGYLVFGVGIEGLAITVGKGLALAIHVLLIIWMAVFLYNFVTETGALSVIKGSIVSVFHDRFIQFLMLAWLFSSFLQGIAGFGVPVAIVTPILISLGFDPLTSACAVLLGHSWAITFGSMGSSFLTLSLVTGLSPQLLGPWLVLFDVFAMIATGLAVSFLYGGIKGVVKGFWLVLGISMVMSLSLYGVISAGLVSIGGLLAALTGIVAIYLYSRLVSKDGSSVKDAAALGKKDGLTFFEAVLPYSLVVFFSLMFYLIPLGSIGLAFSFPGYSTGLGVVVEAAKSYAKVKLFAHPAPIILYSSIISIIYYSMRVKSWKRDNLPNMLRLTVKKCIGTTLSLFFLIPMALVMMDSGMIEKLAGGAAEVTGRLFPLVSPLIGVLGSFITGSNTNSNVIFGSFQQSVAQKLAVSEQIMCAAQSIGASVGCSLGPTQVLLGTTSAKLDGKEHLVYKRILFITLGIALILGVLNLSLMLIVG